MKIVHTSDLHLGKRLHQHSLLADQKHILSQIVEHLRSVAPDVFVVAGDVFDRSLPPEDAMELFGWWLTKIREYLPDLPIVIISGNHDSGKRLSWASSLLKSGGLYIRGNPKEVDVAIQVTTQNGEEAEIWALAFAWAGDLPQGEDDVVSQAGAFASAMKIIESHRNPSKIQILVAHCFAVGGEVSESERILLGQATLIESHQFSGFDYVALGHLHRPQRVLDHVWYSGSPLGYSFSECTHKKCILLVDVSKSEIEVHKVPLSPLTSIHIIKDTYDVLTQTTKYDGFREDYLSVRLTEPCIEPNLMQSLRNRFPKLLEVRVFRREDQEHLSESTESIEGSSLEQDLDRFWCHITGESPSKEVLEAFEQNRPKEASK